MGCAATRKQTKNAACEKSLGRTIHVGEFQDAKWIVRRRSTTSCHASSLQMHAAAPSSSARADPILRPEKNTTRDPGAARRIAGNASSPFMSGMSMSSKTRSG